MATKFVGLDLGTHTVKVCEVVTTLRNFELVGFGSETVECALDEQPTFEQLAQAARTLLNRRGLLNDIIICSLPPGLSATVQVELPFSQPKKIAGVLPGELDELIALEIEDVIYDYQVIEKKETGVTLLCAYTRRDVLSGLLSALQEAGIDPKRVCIGPLSNFNLYDYLIGADSRSAIAILDIGHRHSELTIFDDSQPRITRDFGVGGLAFTQSISRAFQVAIDEAERGKLAEGELLMGDATQSESPEGEMSRRQLMGQACQQAMNHIVREVKRSLAAHEIASGHSIQRVYVTGGGSRLGGLPQYLAAQLNIDVQLLEPLSVPFNRLAVQREALRPFVSKALALSVQPNIRPSKDSINLRREEFSYTGDFGMLRGQILSVALAVVCMIIMGSFVAITKKNVLEAQHAVLKGQIVKLSNEILGVESEDVDLLLSTVAANKGKTEKSIPKASAFQLLSQVSEEISGELKMDVNHFELSLASNKLQLRGKTGSGGDVERLVESLQRIKCLKQVKKERVEKSVDDRTKFRVSATSTCS